MYSFIHKNMISSYHLLFLMWPDFYVDSENQFGYGMEI